MGKLCVRCHLRIKRTDKGQEHRCGRGELECPRGKNDRLQRRAAGVRLILGCRGMFVVVTGRAVLLRGCIVRVIRTEGFAYAVVDTEQEGQRGDDRKTWDQYTVSAKTSKHHDVMLQHNDPRCQSLKEHAHLSRTS